MTTRGELSPDPAPPDRAPGMKDRTRRFDWAATPLGPREGWPQSLRTTVDTMLASAHAMCLIWGRDRILLYNDGYAPVLGARHPSALGQPTAAVWPELWDEIGPLVDRTFAGESFSFRDQPLTMMRHGFAEETWWDFAYSPVLDERGEVAGLLNVTSDSTARMIAVRERDQALSELRASETFLSSVLGASTDCIKVLDLEGRLTFMSEGGQQVMEVSDFNAIVGCPWPDFWAGAGNAEAVAALEAARRGEARSFIGRAATMRGTPKWWHVAVSPIIGADGRPDRILSVSRDITAFRVSEEERDRFARLVENSTDFVGMANTDGRVFYLNDAARRMVGLDDADTEHLVIADFFPPDQQETIARTVLPAVDRVGHWSGELCFRHFATGALIPVLYSVFPISDATGTLIGYGTVTRDFRERKRAEDDMRMMNGELAHRLKNVLAVVQSVAQQTLRTASDMTSASEALSARLVALGSATDVLTNASWKSADLRELVERALAPHAELGRRIVVEGPMATLKPEVSVAFALALHELATNAAKYGALSNEDGVVRLAWRIDRGRPEAGFSLRWEERGGPPVVPPARRGFGSTLIERSLKAYFGGRAVADFRPEGVVFELTSRLEDALAPAEDGAGTR